jgi:hypothetical protein
LVESRAPGRKILIDDLSIRIHRAAAMKRCRRAGRENAGTDEKQIPTSDSPRLSDGMVRFKWLGAA